MLDRRLLLAVTAIVFAGGCSLFGIDVFDLAPEDPPTAEDAGTADATAAPQPDAGNAPATPPFCETVGADAALCDDFENGGTFTGRWPEQAQDLGTLETIDRVGIGGGRALRLSVASKPGQDARIFLGYATPRVALYLDCEVAVRLTSIPKTTYAAGPLYVEYYPAGGGRERVGFTLDDQRVIGTHSTVFAADGTVTFGAIPRAIATLPLGVWTRIRLVVDLGSSPKMLSAYVDGTLKGEETLAGFTPEKATIRIGAHYVGTTDGGTVGYDLDDARISWR